MPKFLNLFHSREFLVFLVVGGISSVANLACGYVLYSASPLPYTLSVFLGAASGLLVNFLLNYFYTFRYKGRSIFHQFRTFFVVAIVGTVLTALLARLFLAILHLGGLERFVFGNLACSVEFLAHALSVGFVTFYSYLAHKFFSFNVGFRERLRNAAERINKGR